MLAISVSYGNDSIAMLQWAHETGQTNVVAVYCDTGWASPSWPQRVERGEALAKSYGFETVRCMSMGMPALVRMKKGWPGNGQQFCTSFLKGLPFLEWIDEVDPVTNAIVAVGKRRAESKKRADTPEFIYASEYHGGRTVWHPLYQHTDEERNELLAKAGFDVLPHRSRECNPCVNANRKTFLGLTPGEVERVSDLEAEVGQPMYRPKRFNVIGIHGVIVWAKDGRKRSSVEEEAEGCADLFGCEVEKEAV